MGKFNIIQYAFYQAIFIAMIGLVCGLLYPFFGYLVDGGITLNLPSSEGIHGFCPVLLFVLKWLWAWIWFFLKWLWALIWIPWVFALFGFLTGIVIGIVIKPIAALFGSSH